MKLVKQLDQYKIFQRSDERYAVTTLKGKPVNGEEKVKVLLAEELIKVTAAAPKPVEEEAPAEDAAEASEEAAE